jgi:hypothetical protein
MLAHKLDSPMVGALLAISVAATTAVAIWKQHSTAYPFGVKSDRLEVVPQGGILPRLKTGLGPNASCPNCSSCADAMGRAARTWHHGRMRWRSGLIVSVVIDDSCLR